VPPAIHALLAALALLAGRRADVPAVRLVRVPEGGIQPQVAVDSGGTLHLVFFRGDPVAGDLFHSCSRDGGATFPAPRRVNRDDGDAVAIGSVRGAHLALGRDLAAGGARVHVAWMGSAKAKQRGPGKATPMLYARLSEMGDCFEPERNVLRAHPGLDGGGSLAADAAGRVWIAWHAPRGKDEDESKRTVWVATSEDDGATFAEERAAFRTALGACACCGMRAGFGGEQLVILFRAAKEGVHRDMLALVSGDRGRSFRSVELDEWKANQCVMSTASCTAAGGALLAAWEDEGQVGFARLDAASLDDLKRVRPPAPAASAAAKGEAGGRLDRKHPSLAVNGRGEVLLAWTEGTGWERGGSLAWQVFDPAGRPISDASGGRDGVPTWSLVAAAALSDGSFVVVY
jgi:hypothetical protein